LSQDISVDILHKEDTDEDDDDYNNNNNNTILVYLPSDGAAKSPVTKSATNAKMSANLQLLTFIT
jgi:hypothetical protein